MNSAIMKIRVKDVQLQVWLNSTVVNGNEVSIPNVTISRTYVINGAFKSSSSFRPKDLACLKEAIEKVEGYLKEKKWC